MFTLLLFVGYSTFLMIRSTGIFGTSCGWLFSLPLLGSAEKSEIGSADRSTFPWTPFSRVFPWERGSSFGESSGTSSTSLPAHWSLGGFSQRLVLGSGVWEKSWGKVSALFFGFRLPAARRDRFFFDVCPGELSCSLLTLLVRLLRVCFLTFLPAVAPTRRRLQIAFFMVWSRNRPATLIGVALRRTRSMIPAAWSSSFDRSIGYLLGPTSKRTPHTLRLLAKALVSFCLPSTAS